MSLLDFDNDDAGITVTTTTDAGFYGNTASIDDPFGFDVFGSNSAGSVKTKSGSADVAKTGNPFDDFDPFGGFGDGSSNVVTTTTSFSATSSSFSKPATDNQFAFDDDFSNNNPTGVVTETNTHLWGGGGDDDFHKGGSSLEEPNGGSDVIHGGNGVIHGGNDVTHDHHQPSSEEEITEVSGGITEPSVFAGDTFWRVDCSSTEKHLSTSLHSDIATPYFDTTVPVDNSLGDSDCETAPDDAVEDSISTTKEMENVALTGSRCDVGLVNGTDVPVLPETSFAFGVSENDEMSEESTYPAGLEANGQADISDSAVPTAASIHTVSLGGFTGSVESDRENTKGSNSGWFDHEASYEEDIEVRTSEKTEDKVDMAVDSRSKPDEEVPDFQKSTSQDFPLTNHRDAPTADHSHVMTSERETISNESYSFNQDRGWKPDHTTMAEKDNTDDFEYQFKAQPDNRRHDVNSHRGQEDNSLADYFSSDNRGRISIDEIRQRSYEDMEPLRSASSHDRNQKEQKTTTDSKTSSVYVLGAASDSTCKVCSKRVYEMEKITADLQVYHKTCFRCTHCSRILSLGNFSTNEGRLYCKPHFMEIFKTKGNYKEGFAAAERNRQQGDRHDISDPEDLQGLNGRSRHSSEENGLSRMRHSSSGREEEYDEADDGAYLQEEIPVVQIKSVRSMFEKMSQDKASPATGQPKKAARTSQVPQSTERGQGKQADQVRRDSLRSEGEREEHERRGSVGDREVVQSSTVCIVEEELPPPSFTKSMLAKFRMMEDVSGGGGGGAKPALPNYGKPASSKQPSSGSTGRHHQTLANRSSSGSNEDDENETTRTSRQHSSAEEQTDELPQAGHAKSLLAQWRNIEEQTKQRGRNRELKKTSTNARRSQSMSRVETVQRANVYRNIDLGSPRSKQAEDIGRSGSYSDQEASEDDAPVSMPTKRSLAKFKELEGGQSMHETDGSHKAKRKFKWEVKEAVPLNRGGIIVHGDVPKRPTTEAADVVRGSEGVADNEGDDYDGRLKRNDADGRREFDVDSGDVVHQSVLTVFNEDELPAPATTRTLLQHFKSMEDVTKAPPLPRPAPSEAAREARSKARPAAASGAFHSSDSDYDEAYRNQKRHSVHSDSEDIQNADAAKESDACDGEELPAQGTTRSLLAKFQSFQTKN